LQTNVSMLKKSSRFAPRLVGSNLTIGKELGRGRFIEAHSVTVRERDGTVRKVVSRFPRTDTHFVCPESHIKEHQLKWHTFHKLGLPVPEFSKSDFRKNSPTRLHVLVPNLEKRHGKLTPINHEGDWSERRGEPTFLSKLKLATDKRVIGELADDLVTLHRNNYRAFWIDFWHFYPKGKTYGRLMLDYENLDKLKKGVVPTMENLCIINTFTMLRKHFRPQEFVYFLRKYLQKVKSKPLAEKLLDYYYPEPPHTFESGNSRRQEHWKQKTLQNLGYSKSN